MKLSHVCHAFRAVALSTSRLWRIIKLHEKGMARMMLGRCNGGSIEVRSVKWSLNSPKPITPRDWEQFLLPKAQQLEKFTAEHHPTTLHELLLELDGFVFPILTDLALRLPVQLPFIRRQYFQFDADDESFPMLRRLTLRAVHIPLDSGVYTNLIELKLYHQWLDDEPCEDDPVLDELMDALEACPMLQILHLEYPGP